MQVVQQAFVWTIQMILPVPIMCIMGGVLAYSIDTFMGPLMIVVLCNPSVLILDEATSSVDTRTEIEINKAMRALMENRTSFVIAHRLSTIVDADLILVMEHGNIIEQGNHTELLQTGGVYAELYNSQFAAT